MKVNQLFTTIDAHTGGEPLRIITGGIPPLKGDTMLERRAYFATHYDHLRKILMHEPRGHHGMYGCVITPPVSTDADFGVLFMHNEGFSTMCGHGIIAVVTAVIETGYLRVTEQNPKIIIDTPAGKVTAFAKCVGTEVISVSFINVPSFVFAADLPLCVNGIDIVVDIAFGGAFYAIVDAESLSVQVDIEQLPALQRWGRVIKEQIEATMHVKHPLEEQLQGIYGVIISDATRNLNADLRNVTIFADGQIDRSPCGTGTAAQLACLYHRQRLQIGELFVHEGIVGSQFIGKVTNTAKVAEYNAIMPTIEGNAFITGLHQFVVDPTDPLADGFLLH